MKNELYYYQDKPYRVLFEGKLKASDILDKYRITLRISNNTMARFILTTGKWIDVVIYTPVYPECEFSICVKEKEDFYRNYKLKEDANT